MTNTQHILGKYMFKALGFLLILITVILLLLNPSKAVFEDFANHSYRFRDFDNVHFGFSKKNYLIFSKFEVYTKYYHYRYLGYLNQIKNYDMIERDTTATQHYSDSIYIRER